jgi:hypothetical protein
MSTFSIRILTLSLMAAPLCSLGCGSGTSESPTGGAVAHGGSGGSAAAGTTSRPGGSAAGGTTSGSTAGTTSQGGSGGSAAAGSTGTCKIDPSTVDSTNYPTGLTLTKACGTYLVDDIYVQDGGVLTIEPGVTLKFSDNTTIFVGQSGTGKVLINGTAQNPITLTTQYDPPLAGGWYGFEFDSGTASGSQVTYTAIDYAGGNWDGAIVVDSALPAGTLKLDHLTIDHNDTTDGAVPILMNDGSPTIACTNCTADGKALTH